MKGLARRVERLEAQTADVGGVRRWLLIEDEAERLRKAPTMLGRLAPMDRAKIRDWIMTG